MSNRHMLHRQSTRLQRMAAWLGVALMLMLALGAASPQFHAWFHSGEDSHHHDCQATMAKAHVHTHVHGDAHPLPPSPASPIGTSDEASSTIHDDDGCVITIFSHGIVSLSMALALLAKIDAIQPEHQVARDWITPSAPRYTWLRTHAPPTV